MKSRSLECPICDIEFRSTYNRKYCSDTCRSTAFRHNHPDRINSFQRKHNTTKTQAYHEYKQSIGCLKCGYNTFGGSLDYHHIDANTKDKGISVSDFYYKTEAWRSEETKCVLVCKNCHYELHSLIRNNIDKYKRLIERMRNKYVY